MASIKRQVDKPLRGVNLGGWLVLEPWLTPALFNDSDAPDEYSYCKNATPEQLHRLKKHRETFIVETDFAWLSQQGVQSVRLPVGYWMFGDEEPFLKTVHYVDKAFRWAKKHGITVLLDLHGVIGSQNGTMHSGRQGGITWHVKPSNIAKTLLILKRICERYGSEPQLLGISVLNEPSPKISKNVLTDFYAQAYRIIRKHCGPQSWVVCADAFTLFAWQRRLPASDFPGLYIDYHHYQIYQPIDTLSATWQLRRVRWLLPLKLAFAGRAHPIIVGEWSLALQWKIMKRLSSSQRQLISRPYAVLQLKAFDKTAAWYYWTYKNDGGGAWSFRSNVESGLLKID